MPSSAVVTFVAENAQAVRYDQVHRPDLVTRSLTEVIETRCGSVQPGYLEAIQLANPAIPLPGEGPLGPLAYKLVWPACLFADAKATTQLTPALLSPMAFVDRMRELAGPAVIATADSESPGLIIGPVRFASETSDIGTLQGTFSPCHGAEGDRDYPFDPAEVRGVYDFIRDRIPGSVSRVTVVVVDNGFFGTPCNAAGCPRIVDGQIEESSRFPRRFFDTVQFDPRAGLGPVLSGTRINPLNYWNFKSDGQPFRISDVDVDSGHGTHVAGLILGGAGFEDERGAFFGEGKKAWLRLVIANLARGQRTLAAGTDRDLGALLRDIDGAKIVNMSIAFKAEPGTTIGDTIKDAILADSQSLFIVAAGNDGGNLMDDRLDLYPASLGGGQANVLTVASVDNDFIGSARLSQFSNRGAEHVDLAAPGCRLLSWLDGDNPPEEISGTSQATPIVSFAAALLSSLWQTSQLKIKNRLLYSGDLLDDSDDRNWIRSRSRLNIAKALTFTFDRVTFLRDGVSRTLLGKLDLVQNLKCANGTSIDAGNLRAVKRGRDGEVSFYRIRNNGEFLVCQGSFSGSTPLSFEPIWEMRDGHMDAPDALNPPIRWDETLEIVRKF